MFLVVLGVHVEVLEIDLFFHVVVVYYHFLHFSFLVSLLRWGFFTVLQVADGLLWVIIRVVFKYNFMLLFSHAWLSLLDFFLFLASYSLLVILWLSIFRSIVAFMMFLLITVLKIFFLRVIRALVSPFFDCWAWFLAEFIRMVFEIAAILHALDWLIKLLVQVLSQLVFVVFWRTCLVFSGLFYALWLSRRSIVSCLGCSVVVWVRVLILVFFVWAALDMRCLGNNVCVLFVFIKILPVWVF